MANISIKRIYDPTDAADGFRVLVDRLWPRGISKDAAQLDVWIQEIAPSTDLRKWFDHDEQKWKEFQARYAVELDANQIVVSELNDMIKEHVHVTFLYGAKDEKYNHAVYLQKYFERLT